MTVLLFNMADQVRVVVNCRLSEQVVDVVISINLFIYFDGPSLLLVVTSSDNYFNSINA